MKEERNVVVIAYRPMAGLSPVAAHSPVQQPPLATPSPVQPPLATPSPLLQTPSPFSFSVASTRWSSRPSIHISSLIPRFLVLVFSFISALSLAAPSTKTKDKGPPSFHEYSELMYCFIATIFAFLYSAYQLFKGVCDIVYRGILISDKTSDYTSFILDQLTGYLLVSSSSVSVLAILQMQQTAPLWKAAIMSVIMSFAAFLVIAACALLSGYRLCKRIMW